MVRNVKKLVLAAMAGLFLAGQASAALVYSENFNSYANGELNGQNGWVGTAVGGGDGLLVDGGQISGDGSDGASRNNVMTLGPEVSSVTVQWDARLRASGSFQTIFGITTSGGTQIIQLGSNSLGFRIRKQDGSNLLNANLTGDDAISTSSHQWFTNRLTFDFQTLTGKWETKRQLGDANFSLVKSFASSDIGALIGNRTNWDGIMLRASSTSDRFDNIVITTIPEPATASLLGLGGLALLARRRRA